MLGCPAHFGANARYCSKSRPIKTCRAVALPARSKVIANACAVTIKCMNWSGKVGL
jgi:hypothetical protein